ncbi:MAG: FkbM family methyltransferase [Nitrosopumilaceae archaeon]
MSEKTKMGSVSHALYFIRQYGKRYGVSKFLRAFFHYGFITIKKILPHSQNNLVEVNGYRMSIMPDDPGISQELQTFGIHEPLSTKLILQILRKGMTCLDIGANIGYYVLLESRIVGNEGKVVAIEPSPLNFNCIKKNLELLDAQNVSAFNFAAGNSNGIIRFFVNKRSNGCKVLLDGEELPKRPGTVIHVPVKRMDDFLHEIKVDKVDFVRMDVEGYELHIIKGMINTIKRSKPIIQLEVHKGRMGVDNTKRFFELLKNNGYEIKSYHQRDLDMPFIGTLKDVKNYSINKLIEMLEQNVLPNYFNLILEVKHD